MRYRANIHRLSRHLVSVPFIYMMIIPTVILDIFLELYHRICFPLYGLELIPRKQYLKLDRWKLPYLRWYDRINCWYCEYANGVFRYAAAIAAKTEEYWCGIKHAPDSVYKEPEHHAAFVAYGDAKALEEATCEFQKKGAKRTAPVKKKGKKK